MEARSLIRRGAVAALVVLVAATAVACAPRGGRQKLEVRLPPPQPARTFYAPWGEHTEWSRMVEIAPRARQRWRRWFARASASYPPASVVLAAFKRERRIEVYAGLAPHRLRYIRSIPVTAASGGPGPKLRQGDLQVPEGIYRVEDLNPNSRFHVSLRLDYPNVRDQLMGLREGRRNLGGDIMIHGGRQSIGCLAVGDEAAEDLYVLAADTGIDDVSVWIAPRDFRHTGERRPVPGSPLWVDDLYADLFRRLHTLPVPPSLAARRPDDPRRRPAGYRASSTDRSVYRGR